jgi:choline dehydrogenase-like flavoprotein
LTSLEEADYIIIIGGGLTGCVVASRLKQLNPSLDIVLIKAGPEALNDPRISTSSQLFSLLGSEMDWAYQSIPQPPTGD